MTGNSTSAGSRRSVVRLRAFQGTNRHRASEHVEENEMASAEVASSINRTRRNRLGNTQNEQVHADYLKLLQFKTASRHSHQGQPNLYPLAREWSALIWCLYHHKSAGDTNSKYSKVALDGFDSDLGQGIGGNSNPSSKYSKLCLGWSLASLGMFH